jgi:WD40 repeat protein
LLACTAIPTLADTPKGETAARVSGRTDVYGDPLPPGALLRLGTTRFRLPDFIGTVALSPDGKLVAVAGQQSIHLLDVATGKEERRIAGRFFGGGNLLHFSADGKTLATYSWGGPITFWDVATGNAAKQISIGQVTPHNGFAFSADGRVIAGARDGFQQGSAVYAWDAETGKLLHEFASMHDHGIRVALSPDGKLLASWGQHLFRAPNDPNRDRSQILQLWDVASGKERRQLKTDAGVVSGAAFAPDGKTLVTGSGGASLLFWDIATGKELRRVAGRRGVGTVLRYSPDGKTLVAGSYDGVLQVWDVATGKRLGQFRPPGTVRGASFDFVRGGKVIGWSATGQSLVLWDAASGKLLTPAGAPDGSVNGLAISGDGETLLSVGADGTSFVWDVTTGKERRRTPLYEPEAMRFGGLHFQSFIVAPNGRYMLSNGPARGTGLWDLRTGEEVFALDVNYQPMGQVAAFSPDGSLVAAPGTDWRTRITGLRLWEVETGRERRPFKDEPGQVLALAFAPEGRTLAVARNPRAFGGGPAGCELKLLNVATGKEVWHTTEAGQMIQRLAFSHDGKVLAVGHNGVELREADNGKALRRFSVEGQLTTPLTFSPDGRTLAAAFQQYQTQDHAVQLLEVASGTTRQVLRGHEGTVTSLAFSPDGRTLASGSGDTTVLLWDLTGRRLAKSHKATAGELKQLWMDMAARDGAVSYRAMRRLAAADEAVPFLKEHLHPAGNEAPDPSVVERWIAELNSDKFKTREKATHELEAAGAAAEPAVRKALADKPTAEAERRLKRVLAKLHKPDQPPDTLRALRALEVLEWVGTPEARSLVQALAGGAAAAPLTQAARRARTRLAGR